MPARQASGAISAEWSLAALQRAALLRPMAYRVDLTSRLCLEAPVAAGGLVRLCAVVDGNVDAVGIHRIGPFAVAELAVPAAHLDHVERLLTAS